MDTAKPPAHTYIGAIECKMSKDGKTVAIIMNARQVEKMCAELSRVPQGGHQSMFLAAAQWALVALEAAAPT